MNLATVQVRQGPRRYVICRVIVARSWDQWREVARVNPLTRIVAPEFRKQLREELKAAVADSRLKGKVPELPLEFAVGG